MTPIEKILIRKADGTFWEVDPSGQLTYMAELAYRSKSPDVKWLVRLKAQALVKAMLAAASAGGYAQSDILHTLLVQGERSNRICCMVDAACVAAGIERLESLFEFIRFDKIA